MTTSADEIEATRQARLRQQLDALTSAERRAVAPLLHLLVHDLNGYLSTVSMEGFTIGHRVRQMKGDVPAALSTPIAEVGAAAQNLERAAEDAAGYLGCIRAVLDDGADDADSG